MSIEHREAKDIVEHRTSSRSIPPF